MYGPEPAVSPSNPPPEGDESGVLVTGGTGTIGSAIVAQLRVEGKRVVAAYHRDEKRALRVQNATGCLLHRADCADEEAVEAMFRAHCIQAVVHAAGVSSDALLLRQSAAKWRETLRVNADGAFLVARAALGCLPDGGRLVLLASRVGQNGNAGQGAYAASKAAVLALMMCAAREGGARRIAVNAVCPGFVPSDLTKTLREERLRPFRERSVFGKQGTAQETAAAVCWLLGPKAASISGQVIHCDSRLPVPSFSHSNYI